MSTLDFYQNHAEEFYQQTIDVNMQNVYQPFLDSLPMGVQHILDVGCGSGRDSVFFANQGFSVIAMDGSQNLIDLAKKMDKRIDWRCMLFDEIHNQNWQQQFTGIWACASLLHVPFDELSKVLNKLIACLKKDSVLYASFKYGDGEREKDGRFFCDMNEERWATLEKQLAPIHMIKKWKTTDNRVDRQEVWWNVLFRVSV